MDWLSFIVGLIGAYILLPLVQGIIGNLLTDPIKNWIVTLTDKSKVRRISVLRQELGEITKLHNDRDMRYLEMFHNLFTHGLVGALGVVLLMFTLLADNQLLRQVILIAAIGLFSIIVRGFFDSAVMVARIKNFDEYKQRTEKEIDKLSKKIRSSQNQMTG